jgi:hypothetical protein
MAAPGTGEPIRDWFLGAIEADGSVDDCLGAVLRDLELKSAFVRGLQKCMAPKKRGGPDAVSDLSMRIKALDNTLRFRLGILRAERPAAWFRSPATTSSGPFSSTLLDEPVLAPYEVEDVGHVKAELALLWQERRAGKLPFRDDGRCLWRTLLGLNAELAGLLRLPSPYDDLSLDTLPDALPPALESRALRAFLLNVRNEVLLARERLSSCYRELRQKCEELWAAQEAGALPPRPRGQTQAQADSVREQLRKRRENRLRFSLTTADQRALACLGFDELPSADALRRRYLELAKKLHPDRAGGEDGPFKELASAYSRLMTRLESPVAP